VSKIKLFFGIVVLVMAISIGWAKIASAQVFQTGDNINISQNQKIENTIFTAGRTVYITSEVYGDIYCAGQTITISGTIHGDVICAGQTVNILGKIEGNIRLAGQNISLESTVNGNATIAGQTFNIGPSGIIKGDLSMGLADANLNGSVGRDIFFGGKNLVIASNVGRNVKATVNNLTIVSTAKIKGKIDYTSNNQATVSSGAQINGKIAQTIPPQSATPKWWVVLSFSVFWFMLCIITMFITAMVIILLFPKPVHNVSANALPRPWKAMLTGFLASICVPIVMFMLAITIIGLPLAFILGLVWLLIMILSGPLFAYYIGHLVLKDSNKPLLIMLIGLLILLVLYFIPIIGCIIMLVAFWIGTGMILLELYKRTPRPIYNFSKDEVTNKAKKR